ncbi:MAG TPA: VCBS repeat-containing protein [Thermoguttaceae bacterium]|nr:VCBS repeat-containing protein [Thermoguttaceae bacterium]
MRRATLPLILIGLWYSAAQAEPSGATYKKLRLTDKFHCEGAYYADFNRDGKVDVVSGPYWYAGPDFQHRYEVREPQEFDPKGYSDNFLTYTGDFNGDGWPDILYVPWPGKDASWYENPAGKDGHWTAHPALKNVGNESPVWDDVNGDGRPDLVYNIDGFLGYGTWDPAKPDEPWTFHPISTKGGYQRYSHGAGIGDINDDGRVDILESACWWEQPADPQPGQPWIRHDYRFADAAAQMLVYDVDGDGLNDVVTAWHCHLYGLVWHEQVRGDTGQIGFQQHVILPPEPDLNSSDLRISQLHAFDLADMNGDGLLDVLTGKRFWAHGPNGDKEPNAPAVVYWFQLQRNADKSVTFIPHQIDDDSGVGTQVVAADFNNDKVPDVVVGNKKGTFVFLSRPGDSE